MADTIGREHGVQVAKSLENLEVDELTDNDLYKEVYVYGEGGESPPADLAAPILPPEGMPTSAAARQKATKMQRLRSNRSSTRGGLHV